MFTAVSVWSVLLMLHTLIQTFAPGDAFTEQTSYSNWIWNGGLTVKKHTMCPQQQPTSVHCQLCHEKFAFLEKFLQTEASFSENFDNMRFTANKTLLCKEQILLSRHSLNHLDMVRFGGYLNPRSTYPFRGGHRGSLSGPCVTGILGIFIPALICTHKSPCCWFHMQLRKEANSLKPWMTHFTESHNCINCEWHQSNKSLTYFLKQDHMHRWMNLPVYWKV